MRPLIQDIFETFLPLAAGLLTFVAGRYAHRLPRPGYVALIAFAVTIVAIAWPLHLFCELWVDAWLYRIGGDVVPAIWAGLFLLGVICMLPTRTLGTTFVVLVVGLVGTILLVQGGGRLIWRFAFPEMWQHMADAKGGLQQSTGVTCGPASAVMLLHHHGVDVSEGEMAYHANTGVTGTNLHALAAAMSRELGEGRDLVRVERGNYDETAARGDAFIAGVKLPHVRAHALFVERLMPEHAIVIDPLEGHRKNVPRAEFQGWWKRGEVVRIVRDE